MDSQVIKQMGLEFIDMGYVLIGMIIAVIILFIILITILVKFSKLKNKYEKFMQGNNAKSLEKQMIAMINSNDTNLEQIEKNRKDIRNITKNVELCFQKVGVHKYDAFREMGGKLSFSIALLNKNLDGYLINSVHSSDGCYSYTKVITHGESDIPLGEEEKKAIDIAIQS